MATDIYIYILSIYTDANAEVVSGSRIATIQARAGYKIKVPRIRGVSQVIVWTWPIFLRKSYVCAVRAAGEGEDRCSYVEKHSNRQWGIKHLWLPTAHVAAANVSHAGKKKGRRGPAQGREGEPNRGPDSG